MMDSCDFLEYCVPQIISFESVTQNYISVVSFSYICNLGFEHGAPEVIFRYRHSSTVL